MPNLVQWNPHYSTGNEILDNQHKAILAQCHALAEFMSASSDESDMEFHKSFNALMALAREHFSTEEALLSRCAYPMLEEHKNEHDEFEYLAADIITTDNFDKIELQRFLALWWTGHIMDAAKKYRAYLEKQPIA